MPRSRVLVAAATGCALGYLVLAVAVAAGLTATADAAVYDRFRPAGVWGPTQVRMAAVVDLVRPVVCLTALALVAAWVAARRRSWLPVAVVLLLTLPTSAVVWVSKWTVVREDPAGGLVPHDGSFPSGHAAIALTAAAGVALVLRRPVPAWAGALVLAFWGFVAVGLLVVGLHWMSDVLGGTLLASAVLASTLLVVGDPPAEGEVLKPWRHHGQPLHNP